MFNYNKKSVITIGNIDFKNEHKISFKIPKYNKNSTLLPIKISSMPEVKNGKINHTMKAGEIIVLIINEDS